MTEFAVVLRIDKVGDKEALNALDALDKKGRQIVENAAGATGKALGDIAVAYERGGKRVRVALEDIAAGHAENIKAMEAEQRTAERTLAQTADQVERIGMRNEHAMAGAARGLEMLGRTGQLTGRSLDAVVGQISQMAFAFGPGGQLVAAIGISTAAIVEMFMRTSREAKKAADDAVREFARIAHTSADSQTRELSTLRGGDPFAENAASRPSLGALGQEAAGLKARIAAGTSTFYGAFGIATKQMTSDAKDAAEALKTVNAELTRRNDLIASISTGSLPAMQALEDSLGSGDKQAPARRKVVDNAAKVFAKDYAAFLKLKAAEMVEQMELRQGLLDSTLAGLVPTKAETKEAIRQAGENIKDAIANDPFLNAKKAMDKAVNDLAASMKAALSQTLGEGLSSGFEAAFSGKGITGAFKALTATVLAGLGGFMEQLGAQMIVIGVSLDLLAESLLSLNGPGAIAAGVALIAAGAGLKAIAGSFGGGSSAPSSGGSSGGSSTPMDFLSFGVRSSTPPTTSQAAPEARPSMVFNVIGNDPKVQRDIANIVNSASGRGLIPGLA